MTQRSEWSPENEKSFKTLLDSYQKIHNEYLADTHSDFLSDRDSQLYDQVISFAKELVQKNIWPPSNWKGTKSSYGSFSSNNAEIYDYFERAERVLQREQLVKKMQEEQEEKGGRASCGGCGKGAGRALYCAGRGAASGGWSRGRWAPAGRASQVAERRAQSWRAGRSVSPPVPPHPSPRPSSTTGQGGRRQGAV